RAFERTPPRGRGDRPRVHHHAAVCRRRARRDAAAGARHHDARPRTARRRDHAARHAMSEAPRRWQFWIDRGGTFTDIVGKRPDGTLTTLKLLSDNPEQYRDAAVAGIRRLLGIAANAPITAADVESVKMGTTVATNALLERKGEPTLLVTTRGFRDALRIAYQDRPKLFERRIVLPELLYARVVEADERMAADGEVVRALDESRLEADLRSVFES